MTFSKRNKEELKNIKIFQAKQRDLAIKRDRGLCTFCLFLEHKTAPAKEVHHVFGRAKGARFIENMFESYFSMLSVCREHHPNPINLDTQVAWKEEIYKVVVFANISPVNKEFIHEQPVKLLGTELRIMLHFYDIWTALFLKEQADNQLSR